MDFASESNVASGDPGEDDDYDLLNDETFGDIQEDFDWDEATKDAGDDSELEETSSKLESRVNELMIDDEPDDPAIITLHARRIPARPQGDNLGDLYGPQSPPAYISTIDGLLDPTHDIWGSPGNTSNFLKYTGSPAIPQVQHDRLREAYLSTSFEKNGGFPPAPHRVTDSPPMPALITDSPVQMPKNAMTVEELERQMNSESVPIPTQSMSQQSQSRPMMPQHPQHASPYQQQMLAGTPPQGHMGSPVGHMMYNHMAGPQNGMGGPPRLVQIAQRPPGLPTHLGDPRLNRGPRPVTILQRRPDQQGPSDPQMYRMGNQGPPPQMYNGMQMPPGLQHRPNMPMPAPHMRFPPGMIPQRPGMMPPRMNMSMHQQMYGGPPRDEYAGLLTKYERDWLIKIQLTQLHTDDPYTDDYYYTIFNLEKSQATGSDRKSGELILPAHAKVETREYKPMQFEGSLGRLTSSSVHKPRQVLDVGGKNEQVSHTAVDIKKYRQTLLVIEKAYQLILDVDEQKKKVQSVPNDQRPDMDTVWKSKLHSLHQLVEENWSALLNVRKGRSLILRTLPLIDKDSAKHLLVRLLTGITQLNKKELSDPVDMKSVRCLDVVLSSCDIQTLLQFSKLITPALSSTVKTLLGCMVIVLMIKQAEKIYAAFVDVPEDQKELWDGFVDSFLKALVGLKSPPSVGLISMTVYDHLAKRPASDTALAKIEAWFRAPV